MRFKIKYRAGKEGIILLTAAILAAVVSLSAEAAYDHRGAVQSNAFSLMAVQEYEAKLRIRFLPGKGDETKVIWYEHTEEGEQIFSQETISKKMAGSYAETSIDVKINIEEGEKRYRCELKNEAGCIPSEGFVLRLSENGGSVLCEREEVWQNE